jgi:hypothetical protein
VFKDKNFRVNEAKPRELVAAAGDIDQSRTGRKSGVGRASTRLLFFHEEAVTRCMD